MALPINIENLIKGTTVESERIEFKKGWNPEKIVKTMCAFANDFHNWGGGYIVIGIEEKNDKPVLPPVGLTQGELNKIQKDIIKLAHEVQPTYTPILQPYLLKGKHILVIWCPAGDVRMYTAPETLGAKSQRKPYIRVGSQTVEARGENLRQLLEMTARIPFDDRVNQQATINELNLGLIQAYLQDVKSDLYAESLKMPLEDIARAMHIAKGPDEHLRPINVGLLFFSERPEEFFPRAWIEVVLHKDDSGRQFEESYFKGPLHRQLREALTYIRSITIGEKVIKIPGRAKADRFYNFPYIAVEEALANAVYHKGYDRQAPIEVQIFPDKITILSFPGPVPPIDKKMLKNKRQVLGRDSRNRRIGDFLKELELIEGRGSGFPLIYDAMKRNGSPKPIFETDEDRTYFLTILPAHERWNKSYEEASKLIDLSERQQKIVDYVQKNGSINNTICQELLSVSKPTATRELARLVTERFLMPVGRKRGLKYELLSY